MHPLEREDFVGLDKGKLDKDAFVSGDHVSKAKDAQDRIVYNETTGALYFDKDGKGGAKAIKFAVLDGAPHLRPVTSSSSPEAQNRSSSRSR